MKFITKSLFAVTLFALTATHSGAQPTPRSENTDHLRGVPRLVKYGDVVRDGSGAPRRGTVGVTFAVYAEREGGSALWMETQNVDLDEQGRYNVMLGAMTRDGLPPNLFGTGESRWLSVQVQLPGETEQARVLLVSVPYAMRAEDSASLGGRPATDYVLREHLTGWSGVLPVTPTTQEPPGGGGSKFVVTATGTVNFVPKAAVVAGADVTYANSQIFDNGTNVGIGTTTPAGLLDISLTTNTNRNSLNTTVALNNSAPINGAVISALNMQLIDQSTANNLSKQSARMVYIRDAAATGGVLAFDTIFTTSAILNSNAPYQLRGANFEFPRVLAGRTLNNYIGLYLEGPPAGNGAVTSKFAMVTEPGAGNVGINTTNPLDALHVDGTVRVSGAGNGIRFPDGTLLTTATSGPGSGGGDITAVNAGTGLSGGGITGDVTLAANFTPAGGDAGAATTVARGDHVHDASYFKLTGGTLTGGLTGTTANFSGALSGGVGTFSGALGVASTTTTAGLALPPIGTATPAAGTKSNRLDFSASTIDTDGGPFATLQTFRWEVAPLANNTVSPSGSLNLLFGAGLNPSNNLLSILGTGNVGIGVSSPASALHVAGAVTATNFVGSGAGLTGILANDANLLDGIDSAEFARFNTMGVFFVPQSFLAPPVFAAGGGPPFLVTSQFLVQNLNADLLDGLDAPQFARTDIPNVLNGNQNVNGSVTAQGLVVAGAANGVTFADSTVQNSAPMWAVVEAAGGLARGSGAVVSNKGGIGTYIVDFGRNIRTCALVGSIGLTGSSGVSLPGFVTTVGSAANTNAVFVQTFNAAGVVTDLAFHLLVMC